jgi:hypothetical protein
LRAEVPEGKLFTTVCHHDFEPPGCDKCLFSCNLLTPGGSFFKPGVPNPG